MELSRPICYDLFLMYPLIQFLLYVVLTVIFIRAVWRRKSKPVRSKNPVAYSSGTAFSYSILRAEDPKDQETNMGEITKDSFLAVFESFPWDEQIKKSNELRVQSPTLTIKDNQQKQALVISMAGQPNDKGYIVAHIVRDTVGADMLKIKQTKNKQAIIGVIEKFFAHDSDIISAFTALK